MKSPIYKEGTVLIRVDDNGMPGQDIFELGVMLQITKITKAKYFYKYLNLRPGQTGNAVFDEIEKTCIIPTEMAKILYADSI